MDLAGFRSAVNRRTGVMFSDAALNDAVNDALQQLSRERRWPWLLTSGSDTYIAAQTTTTLPATFESMMSVRKGTSFYQPVTVDETDNYGAFLGGIATRVYSVFDLTLTCKPTPATGDVIAYRYKRLEATLSNDTDTPVLPTAYHQTVVDLAASYILERSGDFVQSERLNRRYEAALKRMIQSALGRVQGPHRVMLRPGRVL